jgi:hypothetical protein
MEGKEIENTLLHLGAVGLEKRMECDIEGELLRALEMSPYNRQDSRCIW